MPHDMPVREAQELPFMSAGNNFLTGSVTWLLEMRYGYYYPPPPSPPNKPHITLLITPFKISLISLFEAIPDISNASNWLHALALVCAAVVLSIR